MQPHKENHPNLTPFLAIQSAITTPDNCILLCKIIICMFQKRIGNASIFIQSNRSSLLSSGRVVYTNLRSAKVSSTRSKSSRIRYIISHLKLTEICRSELSKLRRVPTIAKHSFGRLCKPLRRANNHLLRTLLVEVCGALKNRNHLLS